MIVTSVLVEFREFLLANFYRINTANPNEDLPSFWIQANWEVLVEQRIARILGLNDGDLILPPFNNGVGLSDCQDDDDCFRISFRNRKVTHLLLVNGNYYRFSSFGTKTNFGDNYIISSPFDSMECISKYGQTTFFDRQFTDGAEADSSPFSVTVVAVAGIDFYDPNIRK